MMDVKSDMTIFFLVTMTTLTLTTAADGCYYKPCHNYGNSSRGCQFSIGCRNEGSFAVCNVSSMILDKLTIYNKSPKCIQPVEVPGFRDFCTDLLYNTSIPAPGPPNVSHDDVTDSPEDEVVRENKLHPDRDCFDTTILASVASGCFIAGGFVAWLFIFCCRLSICPCSKKDKNSTTEYRNGSLSWNPLGRDREIGSTSSAQLLGNPSVESVNTHNTHLHSGDGQTGTSQLASRTLPTSASGKSSPTLAESARTANGQERSPSLPWRGSNRPWMPDMRSRSAQWPGRIPSALPPYSLAQWYDSDHPSIPRGAGSLQWLPPGQAQYETGHSHSMPWIDSIYVPVSESSSRDYQSIHGGSENPYTACSESSSDYSGPQPHRVTILHDGEIYQASSESSGSNYDYTSLKGQRFGRTSDAIYYPTSEGSSKDYASLASDREEDALGATSNKPTNGSNPIMPRRGAEAASSKFSVNGLTFPRQASIKTNKGWTSNLQEINEYETVDSAVDCDRGGSQVNAKNVQTLADMCDRSQNTEAATQLHDYFTLEPLADPRK